MDLFTDKANKILYTINENKVIYSHDAEEDDQTPQPGQEQPTPAEKKMGLDDRTIGAIDVAKKMATQAQGGLFSNPQKKMNKAYGDLMNKIAARVSNLAKYV